MTRTKASSPLKQQPGSKKTGPKRTFTPEQLHHVELLTMLGATNDQLAMYFNTKIGNIEYWMKNYEDFNEAKKRGGIVADMKVAQSLYKRAVGFTYIEEEYTAIEFDGKKVPMEEMVAVRRTKKYVIPETKAIVTWLKNKQREHWMATPEMIHHHTGKVEHLFRKLEEIPVEELTKDAQKLLYEITKKQLSLVERNN